MFSKRKREIKELKNAVKSLTDKTSSLERIWQNYIPGEITYKIITERKWVKLEISDCYQTKTSRYLYKDGREYPCPLKFNYPSFSETGSVNVIKITDKYYSPIYSQIAEEYLLDLVTGKYIQTRREVI